MLRLANGYWLLSVEVYKYEDTRLSEIAGVLVKGPRGSLYGIDKKYIRLLNKSDKIRINNGFAHGINEHGQKEAMSYSEMLISERGSATGKRLNKLHNEGKNTEEIFKAHVDLLNGNYVYESKARLFLNKITGKNVEEHNMKAHLGKGYTLEKVVVHALSKRHMRYMVGCVVKGPRGALYGLDKFGIDWINNHNIFVISLGNVMDNSFNIIYRNDTIYGDNVLSSATTNEEAMANWCKKNNVKYIMRKDAEEFLTKITN